MYNKKISKSVDFIVIIFLFISLSFFGCKGSKPTYESINLVINAKSTIKIKGSDTFVFSFTTGATDYVTFGVYNKYSVGDTLVYKRQNSFLSSWILQ